MLNPDGSWKPTQTSAGQILEKDRLEYLADSRAQQVEELQGEVERLRDWGNGGDAGVALPSLVRIVGDSTASTRQRIKAAAAVFAYKVADSEVITFVRRFLESVCTSTDIGNIDHKVEAAELLRRHEAPRVTPDSVRPNYSGDSGGTEADRREAWRRYEIATRELQIILATKDTPPPGWADDLYSDEYQAPDGWPPWG